MFDHCHLPHFNSALSVFQDDSFGTLVDAGDHNDELVCDFVEEDLH